MVHGSLAHEQQKFQGFNFREWLLTRKNTKITNHTVSFGEEEHKVVSYLKYA